MSWTRSPTASNLLTCRATSWDSVAAGTHLVGATAVTTTGGAGTFTQAVARIATGNQEGVALFYLVAPASVTSMQITAEPQPLYAECVFNEWSGNDTTASVFDQATSTVDGSGATTAISSGTIATPGANVGLAIAVANIDANNTTAPTSTGTGWTQDFSSGDSGSGGALLTSGFAYKLAPSGSTQQTWTAPNATDYAGAIATFNVPAGGAVAQTPYQPWYQRAPLLAQ